MDTWKRHLNTTCNHFAQYSPNLIADTFQHTFSGDMGIQIYIKLYKYIFTLYCLRSAFLHLLLLLSLVIERLSPLLSMNNSSKQATWFSSRTQGCSYGGKKKKKKKSRSGCLSSLRLPKNELNIHCSTWSWLHSQWMKVGFNKPAYTLIKHVIVIL